MKKNLFYFFFLLLASSVIISCQTKSDSSIYTFEPRNTSSDDFIFYDSLGLFWDASESVIYFLKFNSLPSNSLGEVIEFESYNDSTDPQLVIKTNLSTSAVYDTFTFSQNIYGIGTLSGNDAIDMYMNEENGTYTFPDQPEVQEVACDCFRQETVPPENCQHGGRGTSGCSASDSGPLYDKSCSVKCKSGYYACCNDHDVTWQWE